MAQTTIAKGLEAKPLLSPPDLCGAPRATARRSSSSLALRPRSKVGGFGALRIVSNGGRRAPLRVSGSVAAAPEKPSTVPEIVLQPIREISGTVKLPDLSLSPIGSYFSPRSPRVRLLWITCYTAMMLNICLLL
uniref:Uncharacterized protein n=1 Tax=Ananas comosus var. bracteatus TaxID=296719 RepID=A0A6V7Q8B4_ANACO|nr:unnamed protein product [Ananas comosus var. bracteatus]